MSWRSLGDICGREMPRHGSSHRCLTWCREDRLNIVTEATHPASGLTVVLADEGHSWWAYLVGDSGRPLADVWVRSRVDAPTKAELEQYRGGPPPAMRGFDGGGPHDGEGVAASEVKWAADGQAVHVMVSGLGEVVLAASRKRGWSLHLSRSGPWGDVLDSEAWREIALLADALAKPDR